MERTDNDTWNLVIGVGATATLVATATNAENPLNDDPFTECTVFADIDNLHAIAREEMFGPAVTITSYADDDDAIRIAGRRTGSGCGPADRSRHRRHQSLSAGPQFTDINGRGQRRRCVVRPGVADVLSAVPIDLFVR